jgi:hypothetical protein
VGLLGNSPLSIRGRAKNGRSIVFTSVLAGVAVPTRITDPNGNTVTIERDALTNPISVMDGAGRALMITWPGADAPITRVTDPLGRAVTYEYEPAAVPLVQTWCAKHGPVRWSRAIEIGRGWSRSARALGSTLPLRGSVRVRRRRGI